MEGRLRFWDFVLLAALALILAGMFLPWWSMNVADVFGGLDLTEGDLFGDLSTDLLGISTEVTGWDAPLTGLGIAALVLNLLALGFAALKLGLPPRTPLPDWYKQGWVVGFLGSLCTLFGVIVCVVAPGGGYVTWSWRPGSVLVLAGGIVMLVAGVVMSRDQSGSYQGAGKVTILRTASPSYAVPRPAAMPGRASTPEEPGVVHTVAACASCGAVITPDAAYCPGCGGRVASEAAETGAAGRCTRCDAALTAGAAFCSACGWRV